jgi:hypothetical protein
MQNRPIPPMALDLDGEQHVLGDDLHWDHEFTKVKGLQALPYRARILVVCRESNEYDSVLMEGMVRQTLSLVADRPSFARADELGISVLSTPSLPDVHVVQVTYGRAKAVLFELDGDFFLYSMTSAARSNQAGDNDWTLLISAVLRALRPTELVVASISRLVRSFQHSGKMLDAIAKNVDSVRAGEKKLQFVGPNADQDQIFWGLMVMVASSERTLIVQRLTAGLVSKYRRGEWIKGFAAVPLGYRFDEATKCLTPDESQFEALRVAWTMMCDPHASAWQITQALGEMGISTRTARQRYGSDATVADLRDPATYINQLRRWGHLYVTGEHTTPWTNPFKGVTHLAGMPVVTLPDGREELQFRYSLGRPDISKELIHAGLNNVQRRDDRERGGAAGHKVAALNQYAWSQSGFEYWLVSGRNGLYELRVRNVTGAA